MHLPIFYTAGIMVYVYLAVDIINKSIQLPLGDTDVVVTALFVITRDVK